MATVVPFNRRTRASSCTPTNSPQRESSQHPTDDQRLRVSKRRVVYPVDESSPAKRPRLSSSEENSAENSPVKIPANSFYGGGKGRYLSPLERKHLNILRQKNLSQPEVDKSEPSPPQKEVKSSCSVIPRPMRKSLPATQRAKIKSSGKIIPQRKRLIVLGHRSPFQEILAGSPRSPVKNKSTKDETRVYSPSRSGQKFFKSRRVSDTTGQPTARIQRNNLQLKYQPTSFVTKLEENKKPKAIVSKRPKPQILPTAGTSSPVVKNSPLVKSPAVRSSPVRHPKVITPADSPSRNTRSSPWKALKFRDSPSSGRSTITSSKNPNSQDLFSPSDWDFDDDNDVTPVVTTAKPNDFISVRTIVTESKDHGIRFKKSKTSVLNESEDSGQGSVDSLQSNVGVAGDSVAALSEFSDHKSVSPGSVSDQSVACSDASTSPNKKNPVYSIFSTRGLEQNASSAQSTPSSATCRVRLNSTKLRSSPRKKNSPKLHSLLDKAGKEQLTLDFGQKLKGAVQCLTCSMTYNHGEPSDEALHRKFHDRLLAALKFPGWKKEHVLQQFMDGSRIILVMPDEKQAIKKVMAVKKIVDEDLGFVVDSRGVRSNSKTFMYISEDKRIIGFCIAESISTAYRVVGDQSQAKGSQSQEAGSQGTESSTKLWCCSTSSEKARCGINRIWVLGSERRRGTASKLLDCVTVNFLLGFPLKKKDLAFTDPTPDGRAFAMRYTGTSCFLVYKHGV